MWTRLVVACLKGPPATADTCFAFVTLCQLSSICLAVITQEKTIHGIEEFDKQQLKHTETEVKNPLPDKKSQ